MDSGERFHSECLPWIRLDHIFNDFQNQFYYCIKFLLRVPMIKQVSLICLSKAGVAKMLDFTKHASNIR